VRTGKWQEKKKKKGTNLEEAGQLLARGLLVVTLGINVVPHVQDLQVPLQLRGELWSSHVEPLAAGSLGSCFLLKVGGQGVENEERK
jgi:hypothetical protein